MPKVDGKGQNSPSPQTPQSTVEGNATESQTSGSGAAQLEGPNPGKRGK